MDCTVVSGIRQTGFGGKAVAAADTDMDSGNSAVGCGRVDFEAGTDLRGSDTGDYGFVCFTDGAAWSGAQSENAESALEQRDDTD